ncbi:MAG: sulfatase-like hydrolase/transferase [Symploca sp. SIO3E6]|nr:sulfatase-like hydrolase/transferase [Caldora sp. SIO3E6]
MAIGNLPEKPNILILLNDQQSAAPEWLPAFEQSHLPTMQRLKKHGLTFNNMFTATCACSPSRATMLTSVYPTQNGVYKTLGLPNDSTLGRLGKDFEPHELSPSQFNLGHMLRSAGYKVAWKGKWHLHDPINGTQEWTPADIEYMSKAYGFDGWDPPDAGNSLKISSTLGGGAGKNDIRYVEGEILAEQKAEWSSANDAIKFIENYNPEESPFFLTVSLVNPHDVWVAPNFDQQDGYDKETVPDYGLKRPENADENLLKNFKPLVQYVFKKTFAQADKEIITPQVQNQYINFYAYLETLADRLMGKVLDALDAKGLTDNTLIIRLADHGEMCFAHGLREKAYNAYENTMNVPLVISNPQLFPEAKSSNALASTLDLMPTLAKIVGVDQYYRYFKGCDLTPLFTQTEEKVRDWIHFTYDDGNLPDTFSRIPQHIRAIRSHEWKYAVYFVPDGSAIEYEMYNLKNDPNENHNLAGLEEYAEQQKILHEHLNTIMGEMETEPPTLPLLTIAMERGAFFPPEFWPSSETAVLQSQMNRAVRSEYNGELTQKQLDNLVDNLQEKVWWTRR